jgi:hypothetical protein
MHSMIFTLQTNFIVHSTRHCICKSMHGHNFTEASLLSYREPSLGGASLSIIKLRVWGQLRITSVLVAKILHRSHLLRCL